MNIHSLKEEFVHGVRAVKRQKGNISTEWVIATLIIVVALFAPIPGTNQSVVGMMMMAIREFYSNLSLLLSLP